MANCVATATNSTDLEVKDAQLIFGAVWRELEGEFGRSQQASTFIRTCPRPRVKAGKRTSSELNGEVRMKATTRLALALLIIGAAPELRARHCGAYLPD